MRLGATVTTERGKAITKTGNDYIQIDILDEKGEKIYTISIDNKYNLLVKEYPSYKLIIDHKKENGNLKHGKYLPCTHTIKSLCKICNKCIYCNCEHGHDS